MRAIALLGFAWCGCNAVASFDGLQGGGRAVDDAAIDASSDDAADGAVDATDAAIDATDAVTDAVDSATDAPVDADAGSGAKLVAWWKLDEGSGQLASDASGNGHVATLGKGPTADANDPTWAAGCGGALDFGGTTKWARVEPSDKLAFLAKFTIVAMVMPRSFGAEAFGRILSRETSDKNDLYFLLHGGSQQTFALFVRSTGGEELASVGAGGAIKLGVRTSLAATVDASSGGRIVLYQDGVMTEHSRQDALGGHTIKFAKSPLYLGNRFDGARGFDGTIEDLRIYDGLLTPAEIAALAKCP